MVRKNDYMGLRQRILNAYGSQECEKIKAIHSYVHARGMNVLELQDIWSYRPDSCWAHAAGQMHGWDAIWLGTVTEYDEQCYANYSKLWRLYPDAGGKDPRPFKEVSFHCLTSDVIEVADDGKTATSLYATPGFLYTVLNSSGRRFCKIIWERYGTDYVLENGKWVLLHEQVLPDIFLFSDSMNIFRSLYLGYADKENYSNYNFDDPSTFNPREPMHFDHTPIRPAQDTVAVPEPHTTLPKDNIGTLLPALRRAPRKAPMGY